MRKIRRHPIPKRGGVKMSFKDHGLDSSGQSFRYSFNFGFGATRILDIPLELAAQWKAEDDAKAARKEEAARFNRFRRKGR